MEFYRTVLESIGPGLILIFHNGNLNRLYLVGWQQRIACYRLDWLAAEDCELLGAEASMIGWIRTLIVCVLLIA